MSSKKLFGLFLILIIFTCSDSGLGPNENKSYFPLQIGNEWIYEYDFRTPDGLVTDTLVYTITGTKKIKGQTYYEFNKHMPFFPSNWIIPNIGEQLLRQSENGNILVSIDSSEYLFFLFDNVLIDTMIKMKLTDLDYWLKIYSKNETVNTEAGTFTDCYKTLYYIPLITGTEYFIWFAQGYGPVQIYYPEFDITYELIHIKIN